MNGIFLKAGAHDSLDQGGCVMEFAAWVSGEEHSDSPACVSPVIAAFCRNWNDSLDDVTRQRLVPYAIACVGTNTGAKDDETRAWLATDWLVRVYAPAFMDLTPSLRARAAELRTLPAPTSSEVAVAVQSALEHARQESAAARDAAWDAAGDAARAAAWAAARDAAWGAARDALAPTVASLQESAFGLLDAMIAVGRKDEPMIADRCEVVRGSGAAA